MEACSRETFKKTTQTIAVRSVFFCHLFLSYGFCLRLRFLESRPLAMLGFKGPNSPHETPGGVGVLLN
jgi:hypothetical protein